jgi:hypothetical protein
LSHSATLKHQMPNPQGIGRVQSSKRQRLHCAILRCVLKTLAQQTCKSVVWLISDYCASVVLLIFPKTKTRCSEGLLCNLWSIE